MLDFLTEGLIFHKDEFGVFWYSVQEILNKFELSPTNASRFLERHVNPEFKSKFALGVGRPSWYVTKLGIFQLAFKARTPDTTKFQNWLVQEVLDDLLYEGMATHPLENESSTHYEIRKFKLEECNKKDIH